MDVKNILVGVVFILVLYVIYIYLIKKKYSSLIPTQQVKTSINVDVSGNNSSNAYSMWLYITEWDTSGVKHVMTRFSNSGDNSSLQYSPTVYLGQNSNTLNIVYQLDENSSSLSYDKITISDFPIQSWTNLIISTNTKTVDVYINGKLVRSHILKIPPNNPKGKLYLGKLNKKVSNYPDSQNSTIETENKTIDSYSGYISTVNYFDSPLTPSDAWSIYTKGYDDGGLDSNVLGKYKIKMSILDNNRELNSLEI